MTYLEIHDILVVYQINNTKKGSVLLNREQRRKFKKKLSPAVSKLNGKIVKINADQIISSRKNLSTAYSNYIKENKDKEFTAVTDLKTPSCYTFVEDDRFLFYEDDLIEVQA